MGLVYLCSYGRNRNSRGTLLADQSRQEVMTNQVNASKPSIMAQILAPLTAMLAFLMMLGAGSTGYPTEYTWFLSLALWFWSVLTFLVPVVVYKVVHKILARRSIKPTKGPARNGDLG